MKRIFDIVGSLLVFISFLPLLVLLGIIVKLEDGGPVMYRHERIGRYGKPFMLLKFRSMSMKKRQDSGSFEPGDTSRVTRTGRLLRRSKLDELPQLLNVLKGDMSLVGPRPEVERWVKAYPERWRRILKVRPGITDVASLKFRNEEEILSKAELPEWTYQHVILPEKLSLYESYISEQSLKGDIHILFTTLATLFTKTK